MVPVCRCGRRGCVCVWQAWDLGTFWPWVGSGDALGSPFAAMVAAAVCVAGVALGDSDLHFAWQVWHLWHWVGSGDALGSRLPPWSPRLSVWQAWHLVTATFTLRGRCGTYGTGLALVTRLVPVCRSGRRGCVCGRRGTW